MQLWSRVIGAAPFRRCAAGCGARLRPEGTRRPSGDGWAGPWFCRGAACRARRDQLSTTTTGLADALHAVGREIVATGLASGLELVPGGRTRFFTHAGDDVVIDNDLVRHLRRAASVTLRGPADPASEMAAADAL